MNLNLVAFLLLCFPIALIAAPAGVQLKEYGYEDHYPFPWGEKRLWPARTGDNRRRLASAEKLGRQTHPRRRHASRAVVQPAHRHMA